MTIDSKLILKNNKSLNHLLLRSIYGRNGSLRINLLEVRSIANATDAMIAIIPRSR